jgi:hypothetical protein
MEAIMSRVFKISVVQWPQVHSFMQRFGTLRTRNAFSDARRAQAARLLAQQVGPPSAHTTPFDLTAERRGSSIESRVVS